MAAVIEAYEAKGAQIDQFDGVTVGFADRWFNLRASNTEPLLRLNAEGDTPEALAEITDEVLSTYIRPNAL
jgi:phosphomannomutase